MKNEWKKAQTAEALFWNSCVKTYGEETKQVKLYAPRMGLSCIPNTNYFSLGNKKILDIGAGPSSLLLKCVDYSKHSYVLDPLMNTYPKWVINRYKANGLQPMYIPGEELDTILGLPEFDEVWIYNVLQHVINPEKIIKNALERAPVIRLFEWINVPTDQMHIHTLTEEQLSMWLGTTGITESIEDTHSFSYTECYYTIKK